MDVAVCIGRAVMEDEFRGFLEPFLDLVIERHPLPKGQKLLLPLIQLRLHGKIGIGQVEGGFIVHLELLNESLKFYIYHK